MAQLLGGNIDAARSSFIRAISLLQAQRGQSDAAKPAPGPGAGDREAGRGGGRLSQPLQSRTVIVTRAADQQGAARELLEQQGARRCWTLPALGDWPTRPLGTAG